MFKRAIILSFIYVLSMSIAFAQNSSNAKNSTAKANTTDRTRLHRPILRNDSNEQTTNANAPMQEQLQTAGANQSTAQAFLEKGKLFSRRGLYKEATDFFTRATNADQNLAEAYNRRARAEWQLEQNKEALEDANWAIKLNPDYPEVFCTRAAIYNSTGRYQEAVADASMARELNPLLGDAYIIEAAAYRSLNQFAEADAAIAKLKSIADPIGAFDEWHPNIDYTPYFSYIQAMVQQHWHPRGNTVAPAVPMFRIHRSGQISDLHLNSSTGDSSADMAALQAVKSAVPFRQPPAGSPPDFMVYVVLDSPRPPQNQNQSYQAQNQSNNSQPAQQQTPKAGAVNWSGTLNSGINQGLNILQRLAR